MQIIAVEVVQTVAYEAGSGGAAATGLKNSGQTLFSGQAQLAQKSWKIKNISIQWKFSGQILFSGQAQVVQNSEW